MTLFFDYLGLWLILPLTWGVVYYGAFLHKHEYRFYFGSFLFVLVLLGWLALHDMFSVFLEVPVIYDIFFVGHLPFALFTLVMLGGAFKHKSKAKIALMRVRRELAILGFIFLLPHAVLRGSLALTGFNFTGLIAFWIIVPLVITSWPSVRKKMSPKRWKEVHKFAYIVYVMIYVHLVFDVSLVNGSIFMTLKRTGIPYLMLFLVYLGLKTANYIVPWFRQKRHPA